MIKIVLVLCAWPLRCALPTWLLTVHYTSDCSVSVMYNKVAAVRTATVICDCSDSKLCMVCDGTLLAL